MQNKINMEHVEIPITDELDLHTFNPREVKDLLEEYFRCCIKKNIYTVRVIHGKGKGILKQSVKSCLSKNDQVKRFYSSPLGSGDWGSTTVELIK